MQTSVAMGLVELANIDALILQQNGRVSLNKKRRPYKPRRKKTVQEDVVEPQIIQEQLSKVATKVEQFTPPVTQPSVVEELDDDEELDRLLSNAIAKSVVEEQVEEVIDTPKPKTSILDNFKSMKLSD